MELFVEFVEIILIIPVGIDRHLRRTLGHGVAVLAYPCFDVRNNTGLFPSRAFVQTQPGLSLQTDHRLGLIRKARPADKFADVVAVRSIGCDIDVGPVVAV